MAGPEIIMNFKKMVTDVQETDITEIPSTPSVINTNNIPVWVKWILNRLKAFSGKTNWYDTPTKSIEEINTIITEYINQDLDQYKRSVITIDENNQPIDIEYKRKSDNTLAVKRLCSNPDINGFYQTIIEKFYNEDGITFKLKVTYTLTYYENNIIKTSDGGVISYVE
jgi:hypothetical protein